MQCTLAPESITQLWRLWALWDMRWDKDMRRVHEEEGDEVSIIIRRLRHNTILDSSEVMSQRRRVKHRCVLESLLDSSEYWVESCRTSMV